MKAQLGVLAEQAPQLGRTLGVLGLAREVLAQPLRCSARRPALWVRKPACGSVFAAGSMARSQVGEEGLG
jgi:hypothetical protein